MKVNIDLMKQKKKYIKTVEEFKKYFRSYIDDEYFDGNNEIVIYELVPAKKFKKEINYKFV